MSKAPTDAELETAIAVLQAYDGEVEPDNQRDVNRVIAWLQATIAEREVRHLARTLGVAPSVVRAKLAEKREATP